ncbi:MAG TPA: FG-GAP repeat protein [Polyangia bacterium]|jgi:hypothetical protein
MTFLDKPRLSASASLLSLLSLLACGTGCSWSKFGDDADKAPVRSIGAPSGFDSADFGKSLTPLSSGQGSAAAFIATSINDTHMVLVKLDHAGGVSSFPVSGTALVGTDGSAVTSAAEVPGSAPTTLLLGSPVVRDEFFGRLYTYALPDLSALGAAAAKTGTGDGVAMTYLVPALGSADPGLGRGVTTGFLAGVAATPDYVVGSDNEVAVVVDGVPTTTAVGAISVGACEVAYDNTQDNRYLLHRPLMAARLWADPAGATVQQLFVGSTHGTGMGTVSILNVGLDSLGQPVLNCLASVTGARPQFGHALAAGDLDGDGAPDFLVVGAPGQQAFVYLGWNGVPLGTVPTPLAIAPTPAGVDFGFAVATLNVDGIPGDEVLISDPRATIGGQVGAGHVLVYKYNPATATMDPIGEYADRAPDTDANFGYTLNTLNFCRADVAGGAACPAESLSRLLMVGAANETFVYFRVGDNIPLQAGQTAADVRTF